MRAIDEKAIPPEVLELCARLERAGHRAWIVGGCVRDLFMEKTPGDWDVATSALPTEVQSIFKRTIPTGIKHGTITVLLRGHAFEVTTLRGEGEYTDGRRPDRVEFVSDIEEDLARRDFTVNAIAYDPVARVIVDPFGGIEHLDRRELHAVGDPHERFAEDGLRVLRAARFCATLGFTLDKKTRDAIEPSLGTFAKVSAERVYEEWRKALAAAKPSPAFVVMRETGILRITCPRLAELDADVFAKTMKRVDAAPRDHALRIAALLFDVDPGGPPYAWADGWLRGLRASNEERDRVLLLLRRRLPDHLILSAATTTLTGPSSEVSNVSGPTLRRWLRDIGRSEWMNAIELARADGRAVDELEQRARAEIDSGAPLTVRELAVDGRDVMSALSIAPGRHIGVILERLLERVLESPELAARERLLSVLPEVAREVMEKP